MKTSTLKTIRFSSTLDAMLKCKAGTIPHRCTPRGGSTNENRDYLSEFMEDRLESSIEHDHVDDNDSGIEFDCD